MKPIAISKGQYISDIEPFKTNGIPTNSIWHKTVTGCGITTFEIMYAQHHSIIIEPNVPVIKGKVAEHNRRYPDNKILGVYKGIDIDDIKAYLLSSVEYKKILTTPEGFTTKVLKAFAKDLDAMKQSYFLLYDECERIITDVKYRGDIAAPLDIFFEFKNKALVSATTLPFMDSRFDDFEQFALVPDYDYSRPLTVVNTNGVMASFIKHINALQSDHLCIFINSTSGISAIINNLGIEAESKVFCAQDSVVKLLERGHRCASSEFSESEMSKYNFFTGRYFSAVDIKLSYKPDVALITDVYFADHSILDPQTECIQIPGRFRNFEGTLNSFTHITNFNPKLKAKTEEEAKYYLQGCFDTYNEFVQSHEKATHPGSKDMFAKAIEDSIVHSFYNVGKLNKAMVANYIQEERVKGYYQNFNNLKDVYNAIPLHFKTTYIEEAYTIGDDDLYNLRCRQSTMERHKVVAGLLQKWTAKVDNYVFAPIEILNKLRVNHPLIAQAFDLIGLNGLEQTDYSNGEIRSAIRKAEFNKEIVRLASYVYAEFSEDSSVPQEQTSQRMIKAYSKAKTNMKPVASAILKYYDGRRSSLKGDNVYLLGKRRTPP